MTLTVTPPVPGPLGPVLLGCLYDLVVRFGSQQRVKCRNCTCYLGSWRTGEVTCQHCGAVYLSQQSGLYLVVRLP